MSTSLGYKINKHPIAQSFFVDEAAGIYVTKVDLYFAAKDAAFPVSLQIRPMVNGYPSSTTIIPGSQVVVPGSSVNTSANASSATSFTFPEPIFLKGLSDFALVLTADSKDYKVYLGEINKFVVGSTERRINKNPTLGSLFYSQNGSTFTAAQNQDLTFKIYRAKFTSRTGTAIFHNAELPKRLLENNPLTTVASSATVTVAHHNHGLQVGDTVNISGVDSAGVGGISYANLIGNRSVVARDYTGYTFTAGETADSATVGGGNLVLATKNIPYSHIYPHVQNLIPLGTSMYAGIKGTTGKSFAGSETAFQKATSFDPINLNKNNAANEPYIVANSTSETAELGAGIKSFDMQVNFATIDSNVSPMIDLQRASISLIDNLIDKQSSSATSGFNVPLNFVDETTATGGSSASKHITKPVTLATDAVGLNVIFAANRPSASDFLIYYRTAAGDQVLKDQPYILATEETNNPADASKTIFREYRYLIGGQGGDLSAFTQYQLKIVFRSTNSAQVPVIKDMRVIALSV